MIEYVGDSRIDGCPIIRLTKGDEGDEFLNYFRRKNIDLQLIQPLEENMVSESNYVRLKDFVVVKVMLRPEEYEREYNIYLRKQKLIKINEC